MERRKDWYEHPEYYEAIFGTDSEKEMDFLLELNRRYGTGGKVFLEPACGAGRLVAEGTRRGLTLVGYDVSRAMLEHARARLSPAERRRVKLYEARMESFGPEEWKGKVDLAFSLVSTFRYLDSEEAAEQHLSGTRALLKPNGLYALGFHLTDYHRAKPEHERWVGKSGKDKVVCNTREWPPDRRLRRSRMRNRLRVTGPGKDWLIETEWFFRTYNELEAARLFAKTGFERVKTYDFDYRIDQPLSPTTDRLDRVFVLRPEPGR